MRVPAGLTAIRGGIPRRVCFISPHGPLVLTVQGFGQQEALKWLRLHHDSFGNLTLSKGEAGQWAIYPSIEPSRIPKVNIASSAGLAETGAKTHRGRHFFGVNRGYRFLLFPSSLLRHLIATARPLSADPKQPQSSHRDLSQSAGGGTAKTRRHEVFAKEFHLFLLRAFLRAIATSRCPIFSGPEDAHPPSPNAFDKRSSPSRKVCTSASSFVTRSTSVGSADASMDGVGVTTELSITCKSAHNN